MQLKRRTVLKGLQKLGTVSQGRKHEKCRVVIDGKVVTTFPIPSSDNYGDVLIGIVARALAVGNRELSDICECTKGLQWYRDHLTSAGKL
jgi:hypothetical protein